MRPSAAPQRSDLRTQGQYLPLRDDGIVPQPSARPLVITAAQSDFPTTLIRHVFEELFQRTVATGGMAFTITCTHSRIHEVLVLPAAKRGSSGGHRGVFEAEAGDVALLPAGTDINAFPQARIFGGRRHPPSGTYDNAPAAKITARPRRLFQGWTAAQGPGLRHERARTRVFRCGFEPPGQGISWFALRTSICRRPKSFIPVGRKIEVAGNAAELFLFNRFFVLLHKRLIGSPGNPRSLDRVSFRPYRNLMGM